MNDRKVAKDWRINKFLQLLVELAGPGRRTVLVATHITSDPVRVADLVAESR